MPQSPLSQDRKEQESTAVNGRATRWIIVDLRQICSKVDWDVENIHRYMYAAARTKDNVELDTTHSI